MEKRLSKYAAFLLCCAITFMLVACGSSKVSEQKSETGNNTEINQSATEPTENTEVSDVNETQNNSTDVSNTTASGTKTLVVYFSRTGEQYQVGTIEKGNIAIVADMIVNATGADSFEIISKDDTYPTDSYGDLMDVAKQEQNEDARPAYAGEVPDLTQYDTIFIGASVWWGTGRLLCTPSLKKMLMHFPVRP